MTEISVGPRADELVVLFKSDSGAPILSEVPAGPQSDRDANPGECDAGDGKSVGPRQNVMTKNTDPRHVAEKQDKAKNLQKKDAVTRGDRFLADGPARLPRAHRPVCDKNDPRTFNQVTPNHVSSAVGGQVQVAMPKVSWSIEQKL